MKHFNNTQSTIKRKQKKKQQLKINSSKLTQEKFDLSSQVFLNRKIVSPQKLKILVLSGNDLTNQELDFIQKCTSLLKLDLSNNKINKLSKKLSLGYLRDLRVILLHNNRIEKIQGLQGIIQTNSLMHFTLHGNPIMKLPKIQHLVVNMIPSLRVFNSRIVKIEQRSAQMFVERGQKYVDDNFLQNWKSNSSSQIYYIKVLQLQLNYIENVWLRHNPIILIQRVWKALIRQKNKSKLKIRQNQTLDISKELKSKKNLMLEESFKVWKQFYLNRKAVRQTLANEQQDKDKTYLTYKLGDYRMAKRNMRLQQYVQALMKRIRFKIMIRHMAQKLAHNLKILVFSFNHQQAFYSVCQIDKSHRIYFNKNQKHLLDNFLAHIAKNFNKRQYIYSETKMGIQDRYLSIRMVDPQTLQNKRCYNVLNYLIWPSMRVIFLKKRKYQRKNKGNIINIRPLLYIKNRDKVLTSEQYLKSCQIYQRLQRFSKSQYQQSLYYFQCEDQFIMKMVIRYVFYHNRKRIQLENILPKNKMLSLLQSYTQPFVFYNQKIVRRTAAAVRIQQNWRKYICIKNQKVSIYARMKKNRAILKIQRFFRDQIFYQRIQFHNRLNSQLYKFVDPCFLIHQQIYNQIQKLSKQLQYCSLYNNLILVRIKNKVDVNWEYDNYVFPKKMIENHFVKRNQSYQRIKLSNPNVQQTDSYGILHINAQTSMLDYNGQKFIKFSYPTLEETKFRVAILSLITYKVFGKMFIVPIPISDIDYFPQMMKDYRKYSLLKNSIKPIDKKNAILDNKLKNIKEVSQNHGIFGFTQQYKNSLPEYKSVSVQFYQRKFNDYPLKFIGDVFYSIKNFGQILESQKKLQQKESLNIANQNDSKALLIQQMKIIQQKQRNSIMDSSKQFSIGEVEPFKRTIKQSQVDLKDNINEESFLNVAKVDKKRMSLYQIGGNSKGFRKDIVSQPHSPKLRQDKNPYLSFLQTKRQNVQLINRQLQSKKQVQRVQKKNDIKRLREKLQKQKMMNETIKNLKEIQRSQQMKKKIDRIKQFKRRASSNKKQYESQFIQQGNFVMQQQLKMVIMKNKFKDKQLNQQNKLSSTISVKQSIQNRMGKTVSVMSKKQDQDVNEKYKSQIMDEQDIQGEQRQIRNTKASFALTKRNRNNSIGAYIRDPAFVHGVFPQQYYPIENKRNMKIKFPPL